MLLSRFWETGSRWWLVHALLPCPVAGYNRSVDDFLPEWAACWCLECTGWHWCGNGRRTWRSAESIFTAALHPQNGQDEKIVDLPISICSWPRTASTGTLMDCRTIWPSPGAVPSPFQDKCRIAFWRSGRATKSVCSLDFSSKGWRWAPWIVAQSTNVKFQFVQRNENAGATWSARRRVKRPELRI